MVICNNDKCEHNGNKVKGICDLDDTYIDDDSCVSRRKKQQEENYNGLMSKNNPNCHSSGGKYKSNRVTLLK